MSSPVVEEGQFDDAPTGIHPHDVRQGFNYVDETPLEPSEDSSEDSEDGDDPLSEGSDGDFTRVEDEDWEIAERGTSLNPSPLYFSFNFP